MINRNKPWSPKPEHDERTVYSRKSNHAVSFLDSMEKTRSQIYDLTFTENGAVAHKSSGSKLVDINFAVASLRGKTDKEITSMFRAAFQENPVYAMRWLFYARDAREGLGERNLFRVCIKDLAKNGCKDVVNALIPMIAEYGRWDDLLTLLDTPSCKTTVLKTIKTQWVKDISTPNNKPISLMAKWLPSEQASNVDMKRYAKVIAAYLKVSPREYRKSLSALRKHIDVVERKMSSNNWQAIDYEAVPSKANLIYNKAFLKHDYERRDMYLSALERGEAKINSSVAFPHDIVHKYVGTDSWGWSFRFPNKEDAALEAMWKSLPDMVNGDTSTIVVADGSGSMFVNVGNSNVQAIEVANALAIYFAERNKGNFVNKYITFSMTPQIVSLTGKSLLQNLKIAAKHDECANTNIEAVFDLILETAKRGHMKQEDIPANILIMSDMEFDSCARSSSNVSYGRTVNKTLFDTIKEKYKRAGFNIPHLIFWNLNSRTKAIPMVQNDLGVTLVSGFSPNVCKAVMTNCTDPYDALIETLNDKRYDPIENAIRDVMA